MANEPQPAAVVPAGEREALQQTAQATGERFGSMDTTIESHGRHLDKINGSIGDLARSMAQQATTTALIGASVEQIKGALGAGDADGVRRQGLSIQVLLALFAAAVAVAIAVVGFFVTIMVALIVLYANGKL